MEKASALQALRQTLNRGPDDSLSVRQDLSRIFEFLQMLDLHDTPVEALRGMKSAALGFIQELSKHIDVNAKGQKFATDCWVAWVFENKIIQWSIPFWDPRVLLVMMFTCSRIKSLDRCSRIKRLPRAVLLRVVHCKERCSDETNRARMGRQRWCCSCDE